MFNKLVGPVLVGFLIASAVFNLWASVRYYFTLRETSKLQAWFQHINHTLGAAQALANEAVKYSERNPAMDSVLFQFDLKPKPGATSAPPAVSSAEKP
jgi:hypothetical protein